jgi:hypothetical protein
MPEAAHTAGGSGGVVPPGQHAVEDLGDFRARARQWIAAKLEPWTARIPSWGTPKR